MGGDYHNSMITAPMGKSDHTVVSLKPKSGQITRQRSQYSSRPFRDSSLRSFGQWITQVDWSELDELTDMKAARFQQIFTAQYSLHFKQISIVLWPNDKEWLNNYIRRLIRTFINVMLPGRNFNCFSIQIDQSILFTGCKPQICLNN